MAFAGHCMIAFEMNGVIPGPVNPESGHWASGLQQMTGNDKNGALESVLQIILLVLILVWVATRLFFNRIPWSFTNYYPLVHILAFSILILLLGSLSASNQWRRKKIAGGVLSLYLAITAVALNYVVTIFAFPGPSRIWRILQPGPISIPELTFTTVIIAWILLGTIIWLLHRGTINRANIIPIAGFYFIAFLYLNILRERSEYGDVGFYIDAAINIATGQPLHDRYLYPPFLAVCLIPLAHLDQTIIATILTFFNYLALLLFYFLLLKTLRRYGFSANIATLLIVACLGINVPVLRNFGYTQVNMHLANLVLLSLLLLPRNIFLSALMLSLAVHLKTSPIVLVLAFLVARQWSWLIYFVVITSAIAVLTIMIGGIDIYRQYLANVMGIHSTIGITFRENSIDSLVRSTLFIFGLPLWYGRIPIFILKLAALAVSLYLMVRTNVSKVYFSSGQSTDTVFNSYIPLSFLMVILSPIIWAHHFVLLIFPVLVMLKKVRGPEEYALYFSAWALIFLIPVFDFYPFSFLRLAAIVLCYILLFRFLKTGPESNEWISRDPFALPRFAGEP
jgi:hypothetical protein